MTRTRSMGCLVASIAGGAVAVLLTAWAVGVLYPHREPDYYLTPQPPLTYWDHVSEIAAFAGFIAGCFGIAGAVIGTAAFAISAILGRSAA